MKLLGKIWKNLLRKKCPYSELFWSEFFTHFSEFGLNTNRCGVKDQLPGLSINRTLVENGLKYFGSVTWNSLPIEIREDHSILSFTSKIKQWKPIAYPCTICKSYVGRVGHIKVSDYESIFLNHGLKTFDKRVKKFWKTLRFVSCQFLMFMYLI